MENRLSPPTKIDRKYPEMLLLGIYSTEINTRIFMTTLLVKNIILKTYQQNVIYTNNGIKYSI